MFDLVKISINIAFKNDRSINRGTSIAHLTQANCGIGRSISVFTYKGGSGVVDIN